MVIKAKGFKVHMASFVFSAITVMNKTIMPKANISIISDPNSNESIVLNHQNALSYIMICCILSFYVLQNNYPPLCKNKSHIYIYIYIYTTR